MLKEFPKFHLFFIFGILLQQAATSFHFVLISLLIQVFVSVVLLVYFCMETRLAGRFHKRLVYGLIFLLVSFYGFNLRTAYHIPFSYLVITDLLAFYFLTKAFYLDFSSAPELDKGGARIAIACTALFSTAGYFLLRPLLGKHQVLILFMTIVISFTVMMSAFRHLRVTENSFRRILTGTVLLALFKGYLATNIFLDGSRYFEIINPLMFLVSLYLIVTGGIKRKLIALPEELRSEIT